MEEQVGYDIQEEPIVIMSMGLMDFLLAQDKSSDLIALYTFYRYTANHPELTTSRIAKGLKWTEERVRKNRKILYDLSFLPIVEGGLV